MCQFIPLHLCDYLRKISIKKNVTTKEGNSRNKRWQWTNDETGVAVQSWLWVWLDFMTSHLFRTSERNSVVLGSNPTCKFFYTYFKEWFGGEYLMCQSILLRSCNYLQDVSFKINVATDEDNSCNQLWYWTKDEIAVAAQNWLWVRLGFMAG